MRPTVRFVPALLLLAALLLLLTTAASAQSTDLPALDDQQRLYDLTGRALSEADTAEVRTALERLVAAGADPVVVVRALDATPQETLDQVEQLHGAWVEATDAPAGTAVAVLVNRNPDDDTDARAGVFVGATYDEGNVPRAEQERIVAEALIPPLRDGDVATSLVAALDRLATSIRTGPPVSPAGRWAAAVASGWLPWGLLVLVAIGGWMLVDLARRRGRIDLDSPLATTRRPDDLPPAVGGALAAGRATASAILATLLDLARRGAVVLLPEPEGEGELDEPSVAVRLWSRGPIADPLGQALWEALSDRAEDGRVEGHELRELVSSPDAVTTAVTDQLRAHGWLDDDAPRRIRHAGLLAAAGLVVLIGSLVLLAASEVLWPLLVVAAGAGIVALGGRVVANTTRRLSAAGQRAAQPWRGYREGLSAAADGDPPDVDLAAVLPDLVALEVVHEFADHLDEDASVLADYVAAGDEESDVAFAAFPWWGAVVASTTPPSASGGMTGAGVVSGAGAAGGGGAAGST